MERFNAQAFDLLQSSVGEVLAAARVLELLVQRRDVHPQAIHAAGSALEEAIEGIWAPLVWEEPPPPHAASSGQPSGAPIHL